MQNCNISNLRRTALCLYVICNSCYSAGDPGQIISSVPALTSTPSSTGTLFSCMKIGASTTGPSGCITPAYPYTFGDGRQGHVTELNYSDVPNAWTPMTNVPGSLHIWQTTGVDTSIPHQILVNFTASFTGTRTGTITRPLAWCSWVTDPLHPNPAGACYPVVDEDPGSVYPPPAPVPTNCTYNVGVTFDGGDWEPGKLNEKFASVPLTINCNKDASATFEYVCPTLISNLCAIDTGGVIHHIGVTDASHMKSPYGSGHTWTLTAGTTNLFVVNQMMGSPPKAGTYTGTGVIKTTFH